MKVSVQGLQFILTGECLLRKDCLALVLDIILGGIDSLQFRHQGVFTRENFFLAQEVRSLCLKYSIPFLINNRFDIAISLEADGVHLGQSDIDWDQARRFLPPEMIIGATASHIDEALLAQEKGVNYLGVGHIYPTQTKIKKNPPIGLSGLKSICSQISLPIMAIGGILPCHVREILDAGASGFAVASAIYSSPNPRIQVEQFKELMRKDDKARIIS